jgi:plasmid maintenance system antidote protein VapI
LRSIGGEILKTGFMKPLGVSACGLGVPGIYEVVRGGRAISARHCRSLGEVFQPAPAQLWLNLQNDYDLRLAEGSGIGGKLKPSEGGYSGELTGTGWSAEPGDGAHPKPRAALPGSSRFTISV